MLDLQCFLVNFSSECSTAVFSYLLMSDSSGAMLNIVQDSALLEAIGCQMETVSIFCLWSYHFRRNVSLILSAVVRCSCGLIVSSSPLYVRASSGIGNSPQKNLPITQNWLSICRTVEKITSSKATVVLTVALALQAEAVRSPQHQIARGQHKPFWGIMVRIALLEKPCHYMPGWCVWGFFLFLTLANTLMRMGVLNPGWIAPLFIASLCSYVPFWWLAFNPTKGLCYHFKIKNVKAHKKGVCKLLSFSLCFQDTLFHDQ